ncbi:MAG: hypothetical protein ACK56I_35170, partial [bacterium]
MRTALLLATCSSPIDLVPYRSFSNTLWLVISVAKSLALMARVERRSASGRPSGAPSLRFMSLVLAPPKSASAPLASRRVDNSWFCCFFMSAMPYR